MGLMDEILGNVLGAALGGGAQQRRQGPQAGNPLEAILSSLVGGNQAQLGTLLTVALSMLQQNGGLNGVLDMFRQNGLARQADSWVSTGPNLGISADQLQQVFGASGIGQLAAQLGMPPQQAMSAMANVLPELVNQLTPKGHVTDDLNDMISQGLSALSGRGRM